ncbi:MAG: hypothetical protein JKY37_15485 [Nannocystaceae bacterium]|nr:hypothetical protein [Nannocystaceae bacterium]
MLAQNLNRTSLSFCLLLAAMVTLPACGDDSDDGVADDSAADDGATDDGATDDGATATTQQSADDSGDDSADDGSSMDDAADSTGAEDPGPDLDAIYACEGEFVVGQPLSGPGIDPETGAFVGDAETYVVSTTQLVVRPDDVAVFGEMVGGIAAQLMMTPGLVAISFAGENECGFQRTLSVWEDVGAMYAFTASGAHADVIPRSGEVADTGKVTHWDQAAADGPPTWELAMEKIDEAPAILFVD